jgi:opacity protein-like surface antigen
MKSLLITSALALAITSAPAVAQNTMDPSPQPTTQNDGPTSPDGSKAFGIEPYFGVVGGYNSFDRATDANGVQSRRFDGALVGGVVGVNIPLGPLFVGVEGHGARGFGDIRWEYGARGRAGFRAGDSGMFYASAGYTWIDARNSRGFPDRKDWVWGIGAEFGPRDIGLGGITGRAGPRFRISVETMDFDNIRPMAGVVFHF